jgi:hypothetical protein
VYVRSLNEETQIIIAADINVAGSSVGAERAEHVLTGKRGSRTAASVALIGIELCLPGPRIRDHASRPQQQDLAGTRGVPSSSKGQSVRTSEQKWDHDSH